MEIVAVIVVIVILLLLAFLSLANVIKSERENKRHFSEKYEKKEWKAPEASLPAAGQEKKENEQEPEASKPQEDAVEYKVEYVEADIPKSTSISRTKKEKSLDQTLAELAQNSFKGKKVLLAEDNPLNAEIAADILEISELEVDHVWNGVEAVAKMEEAEDGYYSMIFMDIQMPEMNGYEAAQAIRSMDRPYCKEIPIVAISANAFSEDVRQAERSGMNEHMKKPLDFERLLEVLKRYIPV